MHASPMQELDGFVLGDSQGKKFRIWGKSRSSSFALGSKRQDATSPQIMLPPVQCLLKRFTAQSLHSAVRHGGKYQKGLKKKPQLITFYGLLAPTPASVKHRGGPWCCGAASHWYLVSQMHDGSSSPSSQRSLLHHIWEAGWKVAPNGKPQSQWQKSQLGPRKKSQSKTTRFQIQVTKIIKSAVGATKSMYLCEGITARNRSKLHTDRRTKKIKREEVSLIPTHKQNGCWHCSVAGLYFFFFISNFQNVKKIFQTSNHSCLNQNIVWNITQMIIFNHNNKSGIINTGHFWPTYGRMLGPVTRASKG